jgi:hypothetical protein
MTQIEKDTADFNAILQALDSCSASIGQVVASAPERGSNLCTQAQRYAYVLPDHISVWRRRVEADRDIMVANAAQASATTEPVAPEEASQ